jgi:hypothetical protein
MIVVAASGVIIVANAIVVIIVVHCIHQCHHHPSRLSLHSHSLLLPSHCLPLLPPSNTVSFIVHRACYHCLPSLLSNTDAHHHHLPPPLLNAIFVSVISLNVVEYPHKLLPQSNAPAHLPHHLLPSSNATINLLPLPLLIAGLKMLVLPVNTCHRQMLMPAIAV